MAAFEKAFAYLLKNEGGFVDDPRDPGGATNMGITQKTLSRWRGYPVSAHEVRTLALFEVRAIYETWYWKPSGCDKIEQQGTATALFDAGVNSGTLTAVKLLQTALGLKPDGHVGPKTLARIASTAEHEVLLGFIPAVQDRYVDLVVKDPSKLAFLKGWINRSQRMLELLT